MIRLKQIDKHPKLEGLSFYLDDLSKGSKAQEVQSGYVCNQVESLQSDGQGRGRKGDQSKKWRDQASADRGTGMDSKPRGHVGQVQGCARDQGDMQEVLCEICDRGYTELSAEERGRGRVECGWVDEGDERMATLSGTDQEVQGRARCTGVGHEFGGFEQDDRGQHGQEGERERCPGIRSFSEVNSSSPVRHHPRLAGDFLRREYHERL